MQLFYFCDALITLALKRPPIPYFKITFWQNSEWLIFFSKSPILFLLKSVLSSTKNFQEQFSRLFFNFCEIYWNGKVCIETVLKKWNLTPVIGKFCNLFFRKWRSESDKQKNTIIFEFWRRKRKTYTESIFEKVLYVSFQMHLCERIQGKKPF